MALGAVALVLYLSTCSRTVFWYDSAEYVAAAVTLGIPHPPGHPLYILIGHLVTRLPLEPALAMNALSAVFGAFAVGLAYLVTRRLGASRLASAAGAGSLASGPLFWSQALVAEVYTPCVAWLLLVLLVLLSGLERESTTRLATAGLLGGLGTGVHLSLATCGLGLVFLVARFGRREAKMRRLRICAICGAAALIGAAIYLWIPLRASMRPELNFLDPSTSRTFLWYVTGGTFRDLFRDDYGWLARAREVGGIFLSELRWSVPLAVWGVLWLARRRPALALGFALMIVGNVFFFFDYGAHDFEVFFLPSIAIASCLAGAGAQALLNLIEQRVRLRRALAAMLLSAPLASVAAGYRAADMSGFTAAEEYGESMCRFLPRGAVILNFTTRDEWMRDAVFTHYFQKVKRRRLDVQVVRASTTDFRTVDGWLAEGRDVFLFTRVGPFERPFTIQEEGPAVRLVGRRMSDRSARLGPGWSPGC